MHKTEQRLKDIKEKLKPCIIKAILLKDVQYSAGTIQKGTQGTIIDEFSFDKLQLEQEIRDTFYPRFLHAKNKGAWLILFGSSVLSVPASQVKLVREHSCLEDGDAEFLLDYLMKRGA